MEPITVRILDREYRIACPPEERQALLEASHFLDQRMRDIRDSGRVMQVEKIAIMAALNMAGEVLQAQQDQAQRHERVDLKIRQLAEKLDTALSTAVD